MRDAAAARAQLDDAEEEAAEVWMNFHILLASTVKIFEIVKYGFTRITLRIENYLSPVGYF